MTELCRPLLRFSGVPMMTPGPPSAVSRRTPATAFSQASRKARLQHQILRRIAGDEKLGEEHQVGALTCRIRPRLARLGEIAGDIAEHWIELGDGDTENVGIFAHNEHISFRWWKNNV